uniref:Neutral zinc metallopeptidase, Zn-binding site n=1 Tax=Phytophthora ramorum TaxID=164328 RepID=H3HBS0_PHYRM
MAGSSAVEGSQETAGSLPAGSTNTEPSITGSATTEFSAASSASTEATTSTASSGIGTHDSLTPSTGGSSSAVLSSESLPSNTSGSDAIAYTSVWGSPIVAETSSNRSSAVPTFGDVTSKTGECVTGNPNEYISNEYLDWVWEHRIGPKADLSNESNWNVMANKNWIMDKLVHNNGSMNYCVRWDTDNQLSKDVASKFEGVLTRHYNAWNKWLEGYNCWPFTEIKVNMVGWAAKDLSQFEWKDNSLGSFYEGVLDPTDGVPMCPNECYRFYDNVNNVWSDTSACKGEPFDVSFWLKEDIPYGFGYDWGQELSLNNTLQNLYDKDIMFVGHEIGHGFGLPDFYDLTQKPSKDFPPSIMMAYSSITIAPSDGWMLRRVLDNVKSRYKF